jgi:GAF domain-containing protein
MIRVSIKSKHAPAPNQTKSQTDIDEEDTLQLALAISRSEADEKERQKKILTQKYATTNTLDNNIELNKEIQQNEHEETSDGFISDKEIDQFTTLITDHINNFKYRMLSDQQRHRNITIDTVVQSVFVILQYSHPKLSRLMQLLDDKQSRK